MEQNDYCLGRDSQPSHPCIQLWCWRRLLRVLARRSNQSLLKEISPEYSLEGLMLKLKLQYFGHLMRRTDSLEKTLMLGNIEGGNRRGQQRMRWLDGITSSMDWVWASSRSWWWTGKPGVLQSMKSQRVGHDWETELNWYIYTCICTCPELGRKKGGREGRERKKERAERGRKRERLMSIPVTKLLFGRVDYFFSVTACAGSSASIQCD